jgi:small nuclear ribonucleoprotein (snRNP)-like protein
MDKKIIAGPSNDFLKKSLGKKVKIIYLKEPFQFEGTLTGFEADIITVESESDFRRIERKEIKEITQ